MKRNLFIIAGIFLLIIGLMVTGNIIIVGEKIAHLTHLWWTEYAFYGLLLLLAGYFLLLPMWRIHTAPPFPVLAVADGGTCEELQSFGDKLAAHCDYIPDTELRALAREGGMRTFREDAWLKAAQGITSPAEVLRVTASKKQS